jgi:hypothetical protein
MSVLLEAEQLCIQVTGRDGVEPSNHGSEHRIILFIKADKKVCDQLVITKRRSRRGKVICILSHLGVLISNWEVILLLSSKGNSRIDESCM